MTTRKSNEIKDLEIQNYKNWSLHYAEENEKLSNFLKQVDFDKSDLLASTKCNEMFNVLINISLKLKLDDFDIAHGLASMIEEKFEQENLSFSLGRQRNKLDEKLCKIHTFHENLTKDYASVQANLPSEKQQLNEMESNIQYKQVKLEKYKNEIKENQSYLSTVDTRLFHENILSEYTNLKAVRKAIYDVKSQLQTLQKLPPNVASASIVLDTMRAKINKLDEEIEIKFGNIP